MASPLCLGKASAGTAAAAAAHVASVILLLATSRHAAVLLWVTDTRGASVAKACGLLREKASMIKDLSLMKRQGIEAVTPGAVTQNHKDRGEFARSVSLLL